MHTTELLEELLNIARQCGCEVRQDWLGGDGGGHCLARGRKWLLLDLAQSTEEQLEIVAAALADEPEMARLNLSPELTARLNRRRAA